jgi:hypothetical protein
VLGALVLFVVINIAHRGWRGSAKGGEVQQGDPHRKEIVTDDDAYDQNKPDIHQWRRVGLPRNLYGAITMFRPAGAGGYAYNMAPMADAEIARNGAGATPMAMMIINRATEVKEIAADWAGIASLLVSGSVQ